MSPATQPAARGRVTSQSRFMEKIEKENSEKQTYKRPQSKDRPAQPINAYSA